MDNKTSPLPALTEEESLNIISELCKEVARQEQPVEKITAFLQQ